MYFCIDKSIIPITSSPSINLPTNNAASSSSIYVLFITYFEHGVYYQQSTYRMDTHNTKVSLPHPIYLPPSPANHQSQHHLC